VHRVSTSSSADGPLISLLAAPSHDIQSGGTGDDVARSDAQSVPTVPASGATQSVPDARHSLDPQSTPLVAEGDSGSAPAEARRQAPQELSANSPKHSVLGQAPEVQQIDESTVEDPDMQSVGLSLPPEPLFESGHKAQPENSRIAVAETAMSSELESVFS